MTAPPGQFIAMEEEVTGSDRRRTPAKDDVNAAVRMLEVQALRGSQVGEQQSPARKPSHSGRIVSPRRTEENLPQRRAAEPPLLIESVENASD